MSASENLMWELIETAKIRKLSKEEQAELQKLFIRIAENDARILRMEEWQSG
jgi:adenylate kinase